MRERSINDLAERVFSLPEKWGWEYREPVPARRSPEWEREPLWVEPASAPGIQTHSPVSGKRIAIVAVILVTGLALTKYGILLDLLAIILAAVWFLPALTNGNNAQSRQHTATERRDQEHARYSEAWQAWKASVESWNAGERARIGQADLWFPVTTDQAVSRIDVFGGTPDGWAALVTTLGASLLAADRFILLLDLSEHDVSSELLTMARIRGIPADVLDLPSEAGYAGLLAGLGSEDVSEIIAEAVNTSREAGSTELRSLDAALIRVVTDGLEGSYTFSRIMAGLQVLRRSYDGSGLPDPPLSDRELLTLSAYVDAAGQDDQTQRELQFLANSLELLTGTASMARTPAVTGGFWPLGALVIRTSHQNSRRKDMTDRILVQTLLHHLRMRARRVDHGSGSLVITGCDHVGLNTLESLAQLARRANLKTVLVLEHLRGDLTQLLGGSDSASLIMRMGNPQEAAAAAEHIGRGHKFVMNQISRQLSDAASEGEAKQWGATGTVSDSHSMGGDHQRRNWSRSSTFSRSDTWSRTVNWSTTNTVTDGATASRVYEFAVEPVQIQSMPVTAFIFVGTAHGRRHVAAGDCNPGIALLDRVASVAGNQNAPIPAADSAAAGARVLRESDVLGLPRSQGRHGKHA
jgi:phage FluMu protein gp41